MGEMRSLFTETAQRQQSPETAPTIFTVSQINRVVHDLLETGLPALWLEGEISNFTHHRNGHMYFTLKDESAEIAAVMFADRNISLQFTPADGQKVIAFGQITLYERKGRYQINIEEMRPAGIGKLQLELEKLKERLHAEGLFDARFKQPIAKFPERIGIVTSPEGAALRDILKILRERYPVVEVLLFPARVQGEGASAEIAEAIRSANRYALKIEKIDTLIVTRGGGSLEDLWAFNEEPVARAIFESVIPIISAVGHEVDITIADLVADVRAPTPTAAAQIAVPDRRELLEFAHSAQTRLQQLIVSLIDGYRMRLEVLQRSRGLHRPLQLLREHQQSLDHASELLVRTMRERLARQQERWRSLVSRLESVNPASVLRRGFSVVESEAGQIVRSAEQVQVGERVKITLHQGKLLSRVEAKEADHGEEIFKD
uniref:Exodeoxyribonuclease 7 large subunit n=1 Tax=Acetithermum autotrophicum TaxID=1446466 RepID=H5SSI8_ACEAU|nr:exodeoxyribonuclease VII large subunit [Candidatus Acetothermum autotrophicum]